MSDDCGRESPWCEECDAKVIDCEHAPGALVAEALTARTPQSADQEK